MFDKEKALFYLELCKASGSDNPGHEKISGVEFFNKVDTQGFTGIYNGDTLVVVFRGSTSALDWGRDILFAGKKIPYNNNATKVRVHFGFMTAYEGVRDFIHERIKRSGLKKSIVTGHSFGAALATFCAVDIQFNFPDIDLESCNFASPRVGNKHFVSSFNRRVPHNIRVVNGNDIIPKVPYETWGYRHVNSLVHVGVKQQWWKIFGRIGKHTTDSYREAVEGR
ncbi:MAG: lipase family protein [bacterium]|nr:lipase family protein [bacterium]